MHADLIILNIGQLVTCASAGRPKRGAELRDVGVISDAAVAISGGKIAAVGRSARIMSDCTADEMIDAKGNVVCPGFVDPHTHIIFAGNRLDEFELKIKGSEYLEILAAGGGILSTVSATRGASEEELVELALRRLDKMIACGTTTAEIKTGYGLDTQSELKMLRVIEEVDKRHSVRIVPTFLAAHAVPPEFKDMAGDYLSLICDEMLPRARAWYKNSHFSGRVPFFADVFCERNAFDAEQSRLMLETAGKLGFRLKAHVDEFTNLGGSRMSVELEAASIDHLDAISDDEIALLAASDTIGIITPAVNFNFGSAHFANARKLIDEGCVVALATDYNPGSAPCPSQPMAMALACRYQKLLPAEALNAATINAAFAVGLGDKIGSIEIGKSADVVLMDMQDYREMTYEFGNSNVQSVIKSGKTAFDRSSC